LEHKSEHLTMHLAPATYGNEQHQVSSSIPLPNPTTIMLGNHYYQKCNLAWTCHSPHNKIYNY